MRLMQLPGRNLFEHKLRIDLSIQGEEQFNEIEEFI